MHILKSETNKKLESHYKLGSITCADSLLHFTYTKDVQVHTARIQHQIVHVVQSNLDHAILHPQLRRYDEEHHKICVNETRHDRAKQLIATGWHDVQT